MTDSNSLISPAEILMDVLNRELDRDIVPSGAVVGPATDAQQQAGVISIVDAGLGKTEKYLPLIWQRAQLRVLARNLEHADRIARHAYGVVHGRRRTVVTLPSSGVQFLVHHFHIVGGPSHHFDSAETWEALMFAELLIGLDPIT